MTPDGPAPGGHPRRVAASATVPGGAGAGHGVPFAEAVRVWLRVAALSFGGPAGQIAVMHRVLVEERRWVSEARFLHALGYCTLLPGPEAQQLATYVGWLMHRIRGGVVAGGLFVLPGFLSILALALWFARHALFRAQVSVAWGPLRFEVPVPGSVDPVLLALSVLATVALLHAAGLA